MERSVAYRCKKLFAYLLAGNSNTLFGKIRGGFFPRQRNLYCKAPRPQIRFSGNCVRLMYDNGDFKHARRTHGRETCIPALAEDNIGVNKEEPNERNAYSPSYFP